MAITPTKIHADELPTTIADLYTATTDVMIHNILLHNTTAGNIEVSFGITHGATYHQTHNMTITSYDTVNVTVPGDGLVLASGDALRGEAASAGVNILAYGSTF